MPSTPPPAAGSDSAAVLGYVPSPLTPAEALARTGAVSSQILDLIGIRSGRVTQPGPVVVPYDADPDRLYSTLHVWSVYDVPEDELSDGFQRLAQGLPERSWTIVDHGPNTSPAQSLELTADHQHDRFAVNVELRVSHPSTGTEDTPLILINVVSGVFQRVE